MKRILSIIVLICFLSAPAFASDYGYEFYDGIFLPGPVESYLKLRDDTKDRRGLGIGLGEATTTYAGINHTQHNWITGLLETVPANTPRFEEDGLLNEGAAANLLFNSRFATNGAGFTGTATMANSGAIGADGVAGNGLLVTDSSAVANQEMYLGISKSASDSTTYFRSTVWVRKVASAVCYPLLGVVFSGGTQKYASIVINHIAGTVVAWDGNTAANIGSRIVPSGVGWQVDIWATDNGSNTDTYWDFMPALNADASDVADVTAQGSVTIDYGMLSTGSVPLSLFDGAAAIGAELVTDGSFAAVTEGVEFVTPSDNRDFTVWANVTWQATGTGASIADGTGKATLTLGPAGTTGAVLPGNPTANITYKIVVDVWQGTTAVTDFYLQIGGINVTFTIGAGQTTFTKYVTTSDTQPIYILTDASDGGTFFFDNVSIKPITFTNWTAGTGWAPQATAGALTGKAQKVAGVSSIISQTVGTTNKIYRLAVVATRTAGTGYFYDNGAIAASAFTADGTYYYYHIPAYTARGFNCDASFAGTIDSVSIKEHGTVRLSEAGATKWTMSADLTAQLADAGAVIFTWTPGYAEANATADVGILAVKDAVASLVYHDVSGNGLASHDGTTEATVAKAFVSGTEYKIAVRWPSSAGKFEIGVKDAGSWAWGTEANFDGSFNPGTDLIIGYGNEYPFHIKDIIFYRDAISQALIERRH